MTAEELTLRPSRYLLLAGCALHAMALVAIALSALSWSGTAVAAVAVLLSLIVFVARQWRPVYTSLVPRDGVMTLRGESQDLPVSKPSILFVTAGVVLLRFRHRRPGRRQQSVHLLLLPDSLSPEHRRFLYRYLGGWVDEDAALR